MDYVNQYPNRSVPSIWYIDEVVRKAGLQTRKPKKRRKGGSKYLLYPDQAIKNLGNIHQSADFIGKKYIVGRTEPINIFSSNYYCPFKLYQIRRVLAEKATYAIDNLKEQWKKYPIPNVFRIDNGLQFRGTASGKRCVGTFLKFLLNLNVIPLFGAQSQPWTNPHVEGHNRVFNEKVWGRNWFTGVKHIDQECQRFNQESLEFFHYKYAQFIFNSNFQYLEQQQKINIDQLESINGKKIYFIRFVESFEKGAESFIMILNEIITLPEQYNHQYVFVEWDIEKEQLNIYSEYKKIIILIKQIKFRLNI